MKFLKIVGISFIGVFALLYVTLFTSLGQSIWLPMVENSVKNKSGIKNFSFEHFELGISKLDTDILVEEQTINLQAKFDIFSQDLDLHYNVDIKDLSKFEYLVKQKLRGTFFTQGVVQGKFDDLIIDGEAKVAQGDIKYDLQLLQYNPMDIKVDLQNLQLQQLLYMVHQPEYIDGVFQAKGKISSPNLEELIVDARVQDGLVNIALVEQLHGITLPNSDFTLRAKSNITNGLGDFDLNLSSSLLRVKTDGKIDTKTMHLDAKYDINIATLAVLEKINGVKLNGAFHTNGTVEGDQKELIIDGKTTIAVSDTSYRVVLQQFQPSSIKAKIFNAKLDQLLYILDQPFYTKGDLSSEIDISSLQPLKGDIVTTIKSGLLNQRVVKEQFDIDLPKKADFTLQANTNLENNDIITNAKLQSFAADLTTKKTHYDLEKAKLQTDYTLDVASLGDLEFLTKQKMRGDIKVVGDVTFDEKLLATFSSKKFGGTIDGKLDDTKLTVNTKDIATMKLLYMMYYPEIFESKLKLDLDYDLETKQGLAKLDMGNGKFKNTDTLKMISRILNKDISVEVYKIANVTSKIDDTRLHNELYFESDNVKLQSKKFFIETQKQDIDSKFDLSYKNLTIGIEAVGKLNDPKMKVNFNKAAKQKAKDEIQKAIEKKLKDDSGEKIKGILNNFFN